MSKKPPLTPELRKEAVAFVLANIVKTDSGCWEWQRSRNSEHYGYFSIKGYSLRPHRIMLEDKTSTPLVKGQLACHACDNPPCCNPDHLWVGDKSANAIDSRKKNRHTNAAKTHCKFGHEFTPENIYYVKMIARGRLSTLRHCKRCQLIRWRMRSGWTREEAENTPLIPPNAKTARRQWPIPRKAKSETETA